MSILDELVGAIDGQAPVAASQLGAQDWVSISASLAAHQAMSDRMTPAARKIDIKGAAPLGKDAIVSVAASLDAAFNLQRILVEDQLQEVRFRETADAVLDTQIKPGSKCIIRVVEGGSLRASWGDIARKKLIEDGPKSLLFDKFSVQSVTLPDEERFQVSETMGANFIYAFGRRWQMLRLSGVVLNGRVDVRVRGEMRSMDWTNAFLRNYQSHYRATKLIESGRRLVIYCQDTIYTGYLLSLMPSVSVESQNLSQISISMALSSRTWPANMDNLIPGTLINDGLYLPGKSTPRQYFRSARLASYFKDGYASVENQARRLAIDDFSSLAQRTLDAFGSDGQEPQEVELALARILPRERGAVSTRVWNNVLELDVDALYLESPPYNLKAIIRVIERQREEVEAEKVAWMLRYKTSGVFAITKLVAAAADAREEYERISAKLSNVITATERLRQKVVELNGLATSLRTAYKRMTQLGVSSSGEGLDASVPVPLGDEVAA